MNDKTFAISIMLIVIVIGAVGQILFKKAAPTLQPNTSILTNWTFIAACALYGIALILSMIAYRYADVSILYPMMSLSYIIVLFLAAIFLGEKVTILKVLGSGVIILGVALIAT